MIGVALPEAPLALMKSTKTTPTPSPPVCPVTGKLETWLQWAP
jgi:hypothetical protein